MGDGKRMNGLIIGAAAILLGCGYYVESRAYLRGAMLGTASSGLYTQLLAYGMALCGGLCILRSLRSAKSEKAKTPLKHVRFVLIVLLAIVYIYSLEYLGYIVSSILMGGVLLYTMKERNPLRLVFFSAAYALVIYAMFVKALLISLPEPWFM